MLTQGSEPMDCSSATAEDIPLEAQQPGSKEQQLQNIIKELESELKRKENENETLREK